MFIEDNSADSDHRERRCGGWRLGADRALFFLHELVWKSLLIGSPILLGTLVVGLLIGVLQVATQIQEITLSYVPIIDRCIPLAAQAQADAGEAGSETALILQQFSHRQRPN